MIKLNEAAPEFAGTSTKGVAVKLSALRGKYVVLFFFPKAFTPGCTRESKQFSDAYPELKSLGAEVIGVSTDDHQTQCEFAEAVGAQYPMIGDSDGSIARQFDVFWPFLKYVRRVTFIIDPEGIVRAVLNHEARISKHVDESVSTLQRLQRKTAPAASSTELPIVP